ncbi:hypothetical protein [Geodermatophilus sp. FMUSA9-8]|uniref:hypothetical protein n=1 Tax=Geodermatophilus sp. FMUSA9-8 TaxID=3120155 RepID=UPI00300A9096
MRAAPGSLTTSARRPGLRPGTLWLLAAPSLRASRTRAALVAGGTGAAGGLVLITAALFRVPAFALPPRDTTGSYEVSYDSRFAAIVTSAETRIGVVTAVLLVAATALVLAWQAVSAGSARRHRRDRALVIAGATPGDLRRLGAAETAVAGAAGGLLAGPVYLLLWLLLGPAQPAASRLLPALAAADLLAWACLVPVSAALAAAAGACSGAARTRRSHRKWWWLVLAGVALAAVLILSRLGGVADRQVQVALMSAAVAVLLLAALAAGTPWVRLKASRMSRRASAADVLATAGLRALAGPAGRAAGVLLGAGLTTGVATVLLGNTLRQSSAFGSGGALPGIVLTAVAAALAGLSALATIALAAVDDLLTTRRSLAAMAAVGADLATLQALQRRRLRAVTVAPLICGLLLGGLGYGALTAAAAGPATDMWPLLVIGPVEVVLLVLANRAIVRLLAGRTVTAIDPVHLRAA